MENNQVQSNVNEKLKKVTGKEISEDLTDYSYTEDFQ